VEAESEDDEGGGASSFHALTFLVRVKKRWLIGAIGALVSIGLGVSGSFTLGQKLYQSNTILFFRPSKAAEEDSQLQTQLNLVKTRENMEAVRAKLKLHNTLEQISNQVAVDVERNTQLLIVTATGSTPEKARDLAAAVRDVFIERQVSQRHKKIQNNLDALNRSLDQVSADLKASELKLQKFTVANRVVDLDKEAQWYLQQLTSLQILYEQAKVERSSVQLQAGNIDGIMQTLKDKAAREKAEASAMDNLGDTNIRAQRLRDLIHDDTTSRAGMAQLKEKQNELERAQRLHAKGLVSQSDLEKAQAAYESQKALSVDTPQVTEWKSQLEKYNSMAVPKGPSTTASGTVLQQMTLKGFDIQLLLVTQDQKVKKLTEAIEACQKRLDLLPRLQRDFAAMKRDLDGKAQEKTRLEGLISEKRQNLEANLSDFGLAQEAGLPIDPFKSNRKIVFIGIAGAGIFVSLVGVLALALLDSRVRSAKELAGWAGAARSFAFVKPKLAAAANLSSALVSQPTTRLHLELLVRTLCRGRASNENPAVSWLITSPMAEPLIEDLAGAFANVGSKIVGKTLLVHTFADNASLTNSLELKSADGWRKGLVSSSDFDRLALTPALSESLSRQGVDHLVTSWLSDYILVIVLAPGMVISTQADLWAERCCRAVLAASAGNANLAQVRQSSERLKEVIREKDSMVAILFNQDPSFAVVDRP
jgi:capsular polysaccharide biosynthesis protein